MRRSPKNQISFGLFGLFMFDTLFLDLLFRCQIIPEIVINNFSVSFLLIILLYAIITMGIIYNSFGFAERC